MTAKLVLFLCGLLNSYLVFMVQKLSCIPYRLQKDVEDSNSSVTSRINVLMISTPNREDLVFPKGGWENDETVHEAACREALEEAGVKGILDVGFDIPSWHRHHYLFLQILDTREDPLGVWEFRSKSRQNCCNMEGGCRGYMFALEVTEELDSWAEQTSYKRKWVSNKKPKLSPEEAYKFCRYDWMRDALQVFLRAIEERGSRRAEKLVELPMFPAADSMAEHQMLTSAGCSEKPPTVQHLEESFTNKCIVQG
ncbi:nudix hydrolase 13, mitochondrial-like isoform X1 [Gossypium australe]|uniref:Nudix hydrolase 13, mitochondrial-like isoform X1 n=1 Tax=Gossypium australe TaxID=47621 RepID=A0A5B6V0C1_9ROSI|nr:nudix hydrolase 13, mitochondrial-like isoform X1 [Gossypium australe]